MFGAFLDVSSENLEDEIVVPAATRMNLENMVLGKIRQAQEDEYGLIALCQVPRTGKFTETERRRGFQGVEREENGSSCLMCAEFFGGMMKKF